jgi:uncharacterized protein YceH (UPF0502 family)
MSCKFSKGGRGVYHRAMTYQLTPAEARVLGCLIEKEITTPEYYPLSVNALVNACNQKSNREPVMSLEEDAVRQALRSLSDQFLVRAASSDSRVAKFEHRLQELFNFHRHEVALLCVLLLRGPQTPGELRIRTERMYAFEDLESLHSALNLLMKREPPLVALLPRQPGTKESRYAQLLSGEVSPHAPQTTAPTGVERATQPEDGRLDRLEAEVAALREQIARLERRIEELQQTPE